MEETVLEVLYETRYHASRSFSSKNWSLQQQNEGVKESLLSLLSARGVNQLKKKWNEFKHPRKLKKWMSLFVSSSGEYVAVATGNQITFLQKDDNYQEPCGIFTSDSFATFTHGAWSDSHGVLGVIDEMDTLYFIKADGEEITRITKRQLKISVSFIGLIAQDDSDEKSSCLCIFNILTSDGLLNQIKVCREPTASISFIPSSSHRSTLKNQFPQNVACLDFHPELSFLVVVGSAASFTNSTTDTGFYCLSLWRRTRNLNLELVLCSPQFEGFFSIAKGYEGPLTTPKVIISPQGKYVAALDLTGGLDIFNLDYEQCHLSIISFDERSYSRMANMLNERRKYFNDVINFTWWSDHILVLAKRSGVVTMIDILSGVKLLRDDLVVSMPVLERAQQYQGCVFLLKTTSSEDMHSPVSPDHKETIDVQNIEQATQGSFNQFDIARLHWSLMSFSERSVSEMYNVLLSNRQYKAAIDFANRHKLDKDEVFKSQWLQSGHGINEINIYLSNIKDQGFVLSECIDKVGPMEDAVKALLAYGLHITDKYRFSELDYSECSQIWDFRMVRLQLLQFRDRLETFVGINMGRFSVEEYSKFRIVPLKEAAITLAESGKIGALNLLFKRHPYSLAPFLLDILTAIPETVPVQTYTQLLPGRSPPTTVALREKDWVECEKMVTFINQFPQNQASRIHVRTEPMVKECLGFVWPSIDELSMWYKNRARNIDMFSGQLDNSLCMVECACRKGLVELQHFQEDILYLHQLIYTDGSDEEINFSMSLVTWEQLTDYEKFKMMLAGVKEHKLVERLREKAIPFMRKRSPVMASASEDLTDDQYFVYCEQNGSFLVRWLKEIASENKLDICLMVIEEGCRDFNIDRIFNNEVEAVECALQCIYLCTLTDRWNAIASIWPKLPQIRDTDIHAGTLEKRVKLAEGHVEAGRLLAYYQVPKPMSFFIEAHSDEKGVKQILRLILSKFGRRQPGKSDNDWANMWHDMQCFQEKAFPFLDTEYMLMEFCRGLLKAGKFSLARNYLKGTGTISLATEKAENLIIQAAREYFFSASSIACTEIWKAKECLNLFPNSKNVQAEANIIDALTVKLPNLGVTLLPVQFRQIRNPMEVINMVITSQSGAYLNVDELIDIAKLLGLSSQDDVAAVQEAVAREAAVAGDLQLAFDLCLILAKNGHGPIWDLCAAIARGPVLDNMDVTSRKQLLGFALSHSDEESIGELLHAWKDLDMQSQSETLMILTETTPPNFSVQGSSIISLPAHSIHDIVSLGNRPELVRVGDDDHEVHLKKIENILSSVAKDVSAEKETNWDYLLRENGKVLSFAALQLPWLLDLSRKAEYGKKMVPGTKNLARKRYMSIRTQAMSSILSWLARNDIAPSDDLIASLTKSILEPPVTEEEDILGCSLLLNLMDAFHGVQIIEEQLRTREGYQEICSIMTMGMAYSSLHNCGVECGDPALRRKFLLHKFQEKHTPFNSDAMNKIEKEQSTFWREWKSKLEEQKRVADQSRALEQLMPGVETARFLSGDFNYIESVVFSLIESLKLEKKPSLKELLKLADTYHLNRSEVLLRYLSSSLISEVWTNDDIAAEMSDHKGEILACAGEVINTISSIVYPVIDGCNKQRLSYVYSILSDCHLQLKGTHEPLSTIHCDPAHGHNMSLTQFYKVLEQECRRVSFIRNLNFKNIARLDGLNIEYFGNEVYKHVDEYSVEALAKMVQILVSIYSDPMPKGLISWHDVYKHEVLSLLKPLETRTKVDIQLESPENFQGFITELEQNFDICRTYIKAMSQADVLDIMSRYYTSSLPLNGSSGILPGDSAWLDCLILVLNFWIRLTDDMQEIISHESSEEKLVRSNPETLSKCLKIFIMLVMEERISANLGWSTIYNYINHGLMGDFTAGVFNFCRAMVYSGCRFGATREVLSGAASQDPSNSTMGIDVENNLDSIQNPSLLYVNILTPLLSDLHSDSHKRQNLHNLLSSLSKLEGNLEDLKRVRYAVWGKLAAFSDNMQLQGHLRVYAMELMQSISGRNMGGLPSELLSDVQPWEGWTELHHTTASSENADQGGSNHLDASSRFTSTLVALKSTQLAKAISPSIEITSDDLLTLESAVSCFLNLCGAAITKPHLEALQTILGEWEGLFTSGRDGEDSGVTSDAVNNWSSDEWDDGWESFQEERPVDKMGKKDGSVLVHPLHICWMEIIRKLVMLSQFEDVLKLIDRSVPKSNGVLLDEDDAQTLSQLVVGVDCFAALKIVLLLPYEAVQLCCLDAVECKLEGGSLLDTMSGDQDLFTLIVSSGIISTIATNSTYSATFSYFCYSVGHFSRLCQEFLLSKGKQRGRTGTTTGNNDFLFLFRRVLFPCFISELVQANQQILAGFLVSQFMHTHDSLSLINITEASLIRYFEGQVRMQQGADLTVEDRGMYGSLGNTVSRLRGKLGSLIQSSLSLLSTRMK